ncbi:MAG: hypothetical protein R6U91_03925 [Bacillota bacterium]
MKKQRIFWVVLFLVMILTAFVVPFTPFLTNLNKVYGPFLFWSIFALIVIFCLGIITARWRDFDER